MLQAQKLGNWRQVDKYSVLETSDKPNFNFDI